MSNIFLPIDRNTIYYSILLGVSNVLYSHNIYMLRVYLIYININIQVHNFMFLVFVQNIFSKLSLHCSSLSVMVNIYVNIHTISILGFIMSINDY